MASFSELMMKVVDGQQLSPIEREQMRQYTNEMDTNNKLVSSWKQIDNKINSKYLDLPMVVIISKTFEEDVSSFTVQIPSDYKHLLMMGSFKTDRADYFDSIAIQFNGDTSTSYRAQYLYGQNSLSGAAQAIGLDSASISYASGLSSNSNSSGNFFLFLPDYNSSIWKTFLKISGTPNKSATDMITVSNTETWEKTEPIRSAKFFPDYGTNIKTGSILTILGIK